MIATHERGEVDGVGDLMLKLNIRVGDRLIDIFSVNVGEGNPATAEALRRLYEQLNHRLHLFRLAAGPARLFHQMMTRSARASHSYTEGGNKLRQHAEKPLRWLIGFERRLIDKRDAVSKPTVGFFVQEFVLAGLSDKDLNTRYPDGAYLYIPDVYPKETAVAVIKRLTSLEVMVWNRECVLYLVQEGIDEGRIHLVPPVLPAAFIPQETKSVDRCFEPSRMMIKSSGSGMPAAYYRALREAAKRWSGFLGGSACFYMPDQVLSLPPVRSDRWKHLTRAPDWQVEPRPSDTIEKVSRFYTDLVSRIPRVIISYPSEMVQVVYSLIKNMSYDIKFIVLPPRGSHEAANLAWAQQQELVGLVLEASQVDEWPEIILDYLKK